MQTKVCCRCQVEKSINEFGKDKYTKDGYNYACKECRNKKFLEHYKKHYQEEKDIKNKKRREYYQTHKEKILSQNREWRENNKQYFEDNREKVRQCSKNWYEKNKEKVKTRHSINQKERKKKDDFYKFKCKIRNIVWCSLKQKKYTKNSHTYEILGTDYEFVWEYLMNTWHNNYGTKYNGEDYHIDHIIPIDVAKTKEEVIKLCHYTNLQLLKPEDNMSKSNKVNWTLSNRE